MGIRRKKWEEKGTAFPRWTLESAALIRPFALQSLTHNTELFVKNRGFVGPLLYKKRPNCGVFARIRYRHALLAPLGSAILNGLFPYSRETSNVVISNQISRIL